MELVEKIKFMRMFKGWSQEEMAEKLDMTLGGYSKLERGETDINYSRLQQIANIFGIDLSQLIGLNDKTVFNIIGNNNDELNEKNQKIINYYSLESSVNYYAVDSSETKDKIEELSHIVKQQMQEINRLKMLIDLMQKECDQTQK